MHSWLTSGLLWGGIAVGGYVLITDLLVASISYPENAMWWAALIMVVSAGFLYLGELIKLGL